MVRIRSDIIGEGKPTLSTRALVKEQGMGHDWHYSRGKEWRATLTRGHASESSLEPMFDYVEAAYQPDCVWLS